MGALWWLVIEFHVHYSTAVASCRYRRSKRKRPECTSALNGVERSDGAFAMCHKVHEGFRQTAYE